MREDTLAILKRVLFAIIACMLLVGCQTVRVEKNLGPIEGIRFPVNVADESFNTLMRQNMDRLNDYKDERDYYPSKNSNTSDNLRPNIGLALSGGGMRSAAFSIGVMSGLAMEKNVFNSIDIISAVSGGSYALSWYYMQQYYMQSSEYKCLERQCDPAEKCEEHSKCKACPAQLLKPNGPFQQHLAKHGKLTDYPRIALLSTVDLLLTPVNFFCNFLFGWRTNTAISRLWYEKQIEQTFHRIPEDACGGHTQGINYKSATFPELGKFIKEKKLPFFIVNATVQLDDDKFHHASKFSNSVFEFTPLHLGSTGVNFAKWNDKIDKVASGESVPVKVDPVGGGPGESAPALPAPVMADLGKADPMSVVRGVSISGAAVDGMNIPGTSAKVFWSAFNLDLGYFMPNYNQKDEVRTAHLIWPFPLYFWHYHSKDARGVKLYLSDGGHSENLGVFSLVRRLPKRIIIVDAEHDYDIERDFDSDRDNTEKYQDGYFVLEGYKKLKASLKADMGVEFMVPGIDGDENIPGSGLKKSSPYETKISCHNGRIGYFPYKSKDGKTENACIEVTYIKLSMDWKSLAEYPDDVKIYVAKRVELNKKGPHCSYIKGWACDFPQESTDDQAYTEPQFKAYRELGMWIVKQCDFQTRMCPTSKDSNGL